MAQAEILAMTTTAAARYQSVLNFIGPRVIVIEEAAEVFEAHIISTLSVHCQHLILIGMPFDVYIYIFVLIRLAFGIVVKYVTASNAISDDGSGNSISVCDSCNAGNFYSVSGSNCDVR